MEKKALWTGVAILAGVVLALLIYNYFGDGVLFGPYPPGFEFLQPGTPETADPVVPIREVKIPVRVTLSQPYGTAVNNIYGEIVDTIDSATTDCKISAERFFAERLKGVWWFADSEWESPYGTWFVDPVTGNNFDGICHELLSKGIDLKTSLFESKNEEVGCGIVFDSMKILKTTFDPNPSNHRYVACDVDIVCKGGRDGDLLSPSCFDTLDVVDSAGIWSIPTVPTGSFVSVSPNTQDDSSIQEKVRERDNA